MTTTYEGNKPYIFISYSHKNQELVEEVIADLQKNGFRVWFDKGIEAGSEWPEYIASHLSDCECVFSFISEDFVKSHNCRRELNFAQDKEKPMLNIYIDDVELTDGMKMQLGLNQALYLNKYSNRSDFLAAIRDAKLIRNCRDNVESVPEIKEQPKPAEPVPAPTKTADTASEKKKTAYPGRKSALSWITALLELSYMLIWPFYLGAITVLTSNFFALVLASVIPHLIIAIINKILFKTLGAPLEDFARSDTMAGNIIWWLFGTVLAVIIGTFFVFNTDNYFFKFLISLGLNIIPSVISVIMEASNAD